MNVYNRLLNYRNLISLSLLSILLGCEGKRAGAPESIENKRKLEFGSILGGEGLTFNSSKVTGRTSDAPNYNVINQYLWRASLDTINFIPLASADGVGGVIVTDWYTADKNNERIKLSIYITDRQLRSDALKVNVFKKVKSRDDWVDSAPDTKMAREIENIILAKARELRVKSKQN